MAITFQGELKWQLKEAQAAKLPKYINAQVKVVTDQKPVQ